MSREPLWSSHRRLTGLRSPRFVYCRRPRETVQVVAVILLSGRLLSAARTMRQLSACEALFVSRCYAGAATGWILRKISDIRLEEGHDHDRWTQHRPCPVPHRAAGSGEPGPDADLLTTFVTALLRAQAEAVCGAGWDQSRTPPSGEQ
jgi:hypothetical protein